MLPCAHVFHGGECERKVDVEICFEALSCIDASIKRNMHRVKTGLVRRMITMARRYTNLE